jgi:methionyl-tRNA formyltransferase
LRVAYLGTSDFAAAVLRRLWESDHQPVLAISRPDAPKGRGRKLAPPPVANTARELGIELFQPEHVNDAEAIERIELAEPDVLVLCAYGALIKEPLLSRFGPVRNVHPSLLPRWRGAAPVERAIMAGDAETGVSIMALQEGLDDGPVALSAREPIRPGDTYGSLSERLERLSGDLLVRVLDEDPEFTPQPEDGVTYAEKINAADRTLDPSHTAVELERVVRALTPHIGARAALDDGSFLGVRRAAVLPDGPPVGDLRDDDGRLVLGTAEGGLELLEVQPPGGKPMDAASYLRGR